jgi:hypothetical protein
MPRLIKGTDLSDRQRKLVLAAFPYRWTHESPHRCQVYRCALCDVRHPYVNAVTSNGHTHPTVPLISDAEWLTRYAFWFVNDGSRLADKPNHCEPI